MAKQAEKGSRIENVLIDSRKHDQDVAKRIAAERELAEINRILRDPSRVRNLSATMRVSKSEGEIWQIISERKQQITKALSPRRGRGPHVAALPRLYQSRDNLRPSPFGSMQDGKVHLDATYANHVISQAQTRQADCPILTIGQVKSSGFREYRWAGSGRGAAAFWPLSSAPQLPNQTPAQGWSNETGANFWAWARTGRTCFTDTATLGSAGVLQFTLPAPRCDSIVYWGSPAIVRAPTPWFIDAQYGDIWANWVIHESPTGGNWPASLWGSFSEVVDGGIRVDETMNVNNPKAGSFDFNREFRVNAGVQAKIYLGLSLLLMAWEGEVSTIEIGGIGDYYEFRYGITYFMTPA